jgi:Spy/CpxP family protein refolding chaperone
MSRTSALAVLTLACALGTAGAADAPPSAAAPAITVDSLRQAVQTDKRGLVERNMDLTPEEAKKFWPLYDAFQKKLEPIQRRMNRALMDYINVDKMTDANAKRIAREVLAADVDEMKLRESEFKKMLAVLPARKAVRYLQIENKIDTLNRFDLAERIPLVR